VNHKYPIIVVFSAHMICFVSAFFAGGGGRVVHSRWHHPRGVAPEWN